MTNDRDMMTIDPVGRTAERPTRQLSAVPTEPPHVRPDRVRDRTRWARHCKAWPAGGNAGAMQWTLNGIPGSVSCELRSGPEGMRLVFTYNATFIEGEAYANVRGILMGMAATTYATLSKQHWRE